MSLEDPHKRMSPKDALKHAWLQPPVSNSSPEETLGYIEEIEPESPEAGPSTAPKRTLSERSPGNSTGSMSSLVRYEKRPRMDSEEERM